MFLTEDLINNLGELLKTRLREARQKGKTPKIEVTTGSKRTTKPTDKVEKQDEDGSFKLVIEVPKD